MIGSERYLARLREAEGLKRAIIERIEMDSEMHLVTFFLLTDRVFGEADRAHAQAVSAVYAPNGYSAAVEIVKKVAADDLVARESAALLARYHPAAAALVGADILVRDAGEDKAVLLGVSAAERPLIGAEVTDHLAALLEHSFCGKFSVSVFEKEKQRLEFSEEEAEEPFFAESRCFEIASFGILDGVEQVPKYATYLADLDKEGDMTLCGRIVSVTERETQKGKPYFQFALSDGTATVRVVYFSRKATLEKIRALKVGDGIVCSGSNELYNDSLSFRVRRINYGMPPADFAPVCRPSREAPKQYKAVFPEPFVDYRQEDLFAKEALPAEFAEHEFVVFDLETTGLNTNAAASMDRIIEIGAVRIKGGEITEKFSTFVACPVRLPEKIISITGINDEMLAGAPPIEDVMPDFYKFAYGCDLVGHNVMFDYRFISHYGAAQDIHFDAKLYDTLPLAQSMLRLSNYKLDSVADHFGIRFKHHRAFDDAFATAKIFIELIRMKKCLPN